MTKLSCPIWDTPATETRDSNGDRLYISSPRAGGLYTLTGSAVPLVQKLSLKHKLLLTTWLCDQRAAGVEDPLVTDQTVEDIKTKRLLPTSERMNRALLFFNGVRLGDAVTVLRSELNQQGPGANILAALAECEQLEDLSGLLSLMEQADLLRDRTQIFGRHEFMPTVKGWLRIEELTRTPSNSTQGFVAMWFDLSMSAAYNDGIASAIRNRGYNPLRIDNKEHSNKIDDEIIAEIRRSRFMVADFSCEKGKARGGVYYEAGFAVGLGMPVIWTCRKDSVDDLHFDTRQYNHIVWENAQQLCLALEARIGATIGDGPLPH